MRKEKINNQLKKILIFQEVNFYQVYLFQEVKLALSLQVKLIKVEQNFQTVI
jgi:hypothetical protein